MKLFSSRARTGKISVSFTQYVIKCSELMATRWGDSEWLLKGTSQIHRGGKSNPWIVHVQKQFVAEQQFLTAKIDWTTNSK